MANNSGFAAGLTNGFETMDRSFARKKSQELQGQSLGLREAQAENANEHRDRSFDLQKENATHAAEMREKNYSLAQASNERVTANQAAAAALAKDTQKMNAEKHNSSMAASEQNRTMKDIEMKDKAARNRLQGKLATGNFDLDAEDFDASDHLGLEWDQFIDPKGAAALDQLESVMNPDSGNGLRDSGTIEAFDYIFKKRINASVGQKTKDGKTIASSRVIDTFPTEDGKFLGLELELTLDDGSTYKAPVTKGRSTSDDDNILLIPIDKAMDQVQSRVMINRALRDSPEATESVRRSIEKRLGSSEKVDLKKEKMKILEMLSKSNSKRYEPLPMSQLLEEANTIMESEFGVKAPGAQRDLSSQDQYLKDNPSPEVAEQYREKYGSLPGWYRGDRNE